MAWTTSDIPNLSGKVAVVTGANGGLGLASAKALAGAGAHVVMAARNQDKAKAAHDEIMAAHPGATAEIVEVDLGSQASTREAAAKIVATHLQVHILMNNAGLMAMPERRTVDGFEMQFGVNHLGHWTFTADLMPALAAAGTPSSPARVVTVTSIARLQGRVVDPDNVNLEGNYSAWPAYGRAKLANFHFALGLQQRFEQAGVAIASLAAHPGLSNTDLQSHTVDQGGGGWMATSSHWMARTTGMPAEKGSLPQLRAATDPDAKGGELYGPRFGTNGPAVRLPVLRRPSESDITTLWQVSEQATGVTMAV